MAPHQPRGRHIIHVGWKGPGRAYEEEIEKVVVAWGTGGAVHLPRRWKGRRVLVFLLGENGVAPPNTGKSLRGARIRKPRRSMHDLTQLSYDLGH